MPTPAGSRLEPTQGEARFEAAESLRAAGRVAEADAALTDLGVAFHQLATVRLERAKSVRRPRIEAIADWRSADGYAGQRLLDLRQQGASLWFALGAAGHTTVAIDAAHVRASASGIVRQGYRGGVSVTTRVRPAFAIEGLAGRWDVGPATSGASDLQLFAAWRPADRWTVMAGGDRAPVIENLATIDRRLTASGIVAGVAFESPRTTFELRLSGHELSDGNRRRRATLSATRAVSERLRHLRLIGWAESLGYRTGASEYFSPSSHVRVDGGLEYTHALRTPRFRGDRAPALAVGYLIGTDTKGIAYHHPLVRLSLEFANGLTIDARANWIRSDVYRETSAFVGVGLRPGGGSR